MVRCYTLRLSHCRQSRVMHRYGCRLSKVNGMVGGVGHEEWLLTSSKFTCMCMVMLVALCIDNFTVIYYTVYTGSLRMIVYSHRRDWGSLVSTPADG